MAGKKNTDTPDNVSGGNAVVDSYEEVIIPHSDLNPNITHKTVIVNGRNYQVKLGEYVRVPKAVAEAIKNSVKQEAYVREMKNQIKADGKKPMNEG